MTESTANHSYDVTVPNISSTLSTCDEYNRVPSRCHCPSRDIQTADDNGSWYDHLEAFTEGTSLHGLKYIANRKSFALRRFIWLCLTLTCSTLLVMQIIDRVQYFYTSPITVNFKVNYNHSLKFPAITICNQNAFRATAARNRGWYRLIERMYKNSSHATNQTWTDVDGSDIPLDRLFLELGHKKEDFIVRCHWEGEICTHEDFITSLTDHGLCFTFNKAHNNTSVLDVSSSGLEHGLRLTLNAEQYEALPGPHDATGIKILPTDQAAFPRVDEIGLAIPTGAHAFVGLGVLVINNLPKPHGNCGDKQLSSTERYSPEHCHMECVTQLIIEKCGCRHIYMPDIHGNTPVCSVRQYFECYVGARDIIHREAVEMCECPTSCNYMIYEPSISYATTSKYMKGHLLEAAKSESLKTRFFEARETTEKMNKDTFHKFEKKVVHTSNLFDNLKILLESDIQERLESQLDVLMDIQRNMSRIVNKKEHMYRYQRYTLQKNFMRARDAMEERTLSVLCLGFHEHVFNTEFKVRQMHASKRRNSSDADILYFLIKNALESKVETATRAHANYTQLYNAYETGERIFNYKYYQNSRTDNDFITPRPLLNASLFHNKYARKYAPRVETDIIRVMNTTLAFDAFVEEMYENSSKTFEERRMNLLSGDFIDACEDFFHSKSTFYFETIDRPLRIIEKRIQIFEDLKLGYKQSFSDLQTALKGLNESLKDIRDRFLSNLTGYILLAKQYFNESENDNVTKLELANIFTSKSFSDNLQSMNLFFNDLRQRGQYVYDSWNELQRWCHQIWKKILRDKDSLDYYKYKNLTQFLDNYSNVSAELKTLFRQIRDDNDLRFIIGLKDSVFEQAVNTVIEDLMAFLKGIKMEDDFIRENFLQLDIYYKELRHEQIDQQKAYDPIALLCDIGGSIGLFIGASVMTVFEILDFAINRSAEQMLLGRKR